MNIKRYFSILLSLVMLMALLPTAVLADSIPTVYINNVLVTTENASDVLGDTTVSYDESTNTLTLNGASITQSNSGSCISSSGDLNIVLSEGSANSIEVSTAYAINTVGTLHISGTGSLSITTTKNSPIIYAASFSAENASITADTTGATSPAPVISIMGDGAVSLDTVTFNGLTINTTGSVTIKNSTFTTTGWNSSSPVIYGSAVNITDSTIDIGITSNSYAVAATASTTGTLTITDSTVTVTASGSSPAVASYETDVTGTSTFTINAESNLGLSGEILSITDTASVSVSTNSTSTPAIASTSLSVGAAAELKASGAYAVTCDSITIAGTAYSLINITGIKSLYVSGGALTTIAAPVNLAWSSDIYGTASWNAVNGAVYYDVTVYKETDAGEFDSGVIVRTDGVSLNLAFLFTEKGSGTYVFTVTAVFADGTKMTSAYSPSLTYNADALTTLSTPVNLTWNNGVASWDAVDGAAKYEVDLNKKYSSGVVAEVVTEDTSYDFSAVISANGAGIYSFDVLAVGDGVNTASSEVSARSEKYYYNITKLDAPTDLSWDKGVASWTEVENALSYEIELYEKTVNNGTEVWDIVLIQSEGDLPAPEIETTGTSYDFNAIMAENGDGIYAFCVTAVGDHINYANSDDSLMSSAYVYGTPKPFYTVIFNANGGSFGDASSSAVLKDGGSLDLSAYAPTRTGYTLSGWTVNADGSGTVYGIDAEIAYDDLSSDLTLYAKWTANSYTVKFNANGGTGAVDDQTFKYDKADTLNTNIFTRTGYTFAGWSDSADGSIVYTDGESVLNLSAEENGEVTLYAQWEANSYTVKFNANGGTGTMAAQTFKYDEIDTLSTNTFILTGYTFAGWSDSANGSIVYTNGESVTNLSAEENGEVTLYAQWEANSYTVTFDANGGEGTMDDQTFCYDEAGTLSTNIFTRTGYTFAGWSDSADGSIVYTDGESVMNLSAEKNGEVTLYAKWTANSYTVEFNANGGTGAMDDQTFSYDAADTLNTNIFTHTGYTFAGWSKSIDGSIAYSDGESVMNLSAEENGEVTLYAKWTEHSYTVSFNANGGSFEDASSSAVLKDGESLDLSAYTPTRTGYTLSGWTVNAVGSGTVYGIDAKIAYADMSSDLTLYAKWTANSYTVNFNANGGEGTMAAQTLKYGETGTLSLNSFTYTGYTFAGWSNSADGFIVYTDGGNVTNLSAEANGEVTLYAQWKQPSACMGMKAVSLKNGTFEMYLGGNDMGEFTFTQYGNGWTIQNAEGRYLGQSGGVFTVSDEADIWNYSSGYFYQTEKTSISGGWRWGHGWTVTTYYYLISNGDSLSVSRSSNAGCAQFYEMVSYEAHEWSEWYSIGNGYHERICLNCGETETWICDYDDETHICPECGAYDPAFAHVDVSVDVTSSSYGFWWWHFTRYTANIAAQGNGTETAKVEYSMDGSRWYRGSSFSSYDPIKQFYIRVTDSNGTVHYFEYDQGIVAQQS